MSSTDLGQQILAHSRQIEMLKAERKVIIEQLESKVDEKIIPAVEKVLPPGYSIMRGLATVNALTPHRLEMDGSRFYVLLRLLYDGKPIDPRLPLDEQAEQSIRRIVTNDTEPALKAVKESYMRTYYLNAIIISADQFPGQVSKPA